MKSSNQDPEGFDTLRKALALKKYEQPPPGYFNRLPNQIMARIEAGEGQTRFWEKFIPSFTLRPAMAYGFGLAMCGAVAMGVYYTSNTPVSNNAMSPMTASSMTASQQVILTAPAPTLASHNEMSVNSTNPVTQQPSLFPSQFGQGLQTAPAGYTPKR